jgi:glycosyltransferase involved in cell wall biosynthesis
VPSAYLQTVFAQYGVDCIVVPNVVDTSVFHPSKSDIGARSTSPHVVIPRNLEYIYGVDVGLRCVGILRQQYPEISISIAGSGPELPLLKTLATKLGLAENVKFTGSLTVVQMAALYRSADIVLNPVRVDNTPNSVLEALACGVPVVSTNVGGIPYLVQHERSALLTEPESPEALAAEVTRLLENEGLRKSLIAGGLQLADECTWSRVRERWLDIYRKARA